MQDFENLPSKQLGNITPPQAGTSFFAKLKTKRPIVLGGLGSIVLFAAIIYVMYLYGKCEREVQPTTTVTPTLISTPQPEVSLSGQPEKPFSNTGIHGHYIFYDDGFVALNLNNGQFEKIMEATWKEGYIPPTVMSGDGDKIAYASGEKDVGILNLSTKEVKYYTLPETPVTKRIVWSADDDSIAYIGATAQDWDPNNLILYEIRISDGESRILYKLGPEFGGKCCKLVSWLSTDELVLTGCNPVGGLIGDGLYLLNLSTGEVQCLTEDFFYDLSVNPSYRLIAYTTLNTKVDPREESLKILDIDSHSVIIEKIYKRETNVDVFLAPGLVWSSLGDSLFFSRTNFSKQKERYKGWQVIECLDLTTQNIETLLDDGGLVTTPLAEIDNTYLLMYHWGGTGTGEGEENSNSLYLYNMQTGSRVYYPYYEDGVLGRTSLVNLADY